MQLFDVFVSVKGKSDMVPLLLLEEKEQEILAKDETIQVKRGNRVLVIYKHYKVFIY